MRVEVEGIVNSDVLERGQRSTVEWTPRLQGLIRGGLIRVIAQYPDEAEQTTPEAEQTTPVVKAFTDEATTDDEPTDETPIVVPPRTGRGAGKHAWRTFVDTLGITTPADATRDQLIDAFDTWSHTRGGEA